MPGTTVASLFGEHARAARARRRSTGEALQESQRGRLLQGVVASAAEKGYAATTIADVVSRAAISRNAFYDHFADKRECFLEALRVGGELLIAEVLGEPVDPEDWPGSTRRRIRTFLAALDELPAFAQSLLLEAPAAGREAQRTVAALRSRLALALLEEQALVVRADPKLAAVTRPLFEALVGGALELVRIELLREDGADVAGLEDDLVLLARVIHEAPPALFGDAG